MVDLYVISSGHGGTDSGAAGNGLIEKDLTIFSAIRTEDRLDSYQGDFKVFQLPTVNANEDLKSVVDYAIQSKARFVYEIHINSSYDPSGEGFETFIYTESTKENARIQSIIHGILSDYIKSYDMVDRKAKKANYYVLRECHKAGIPAMLEEIAFLSNPQDARRLKDIKFLDGLANERAWAITQAFGIKASTQVIDSLDRIKKLENDLRWVKQKVQNTVWDLSDVVQKI